MNQEKAIVHLNKFKNLRNSRIKDTMSGATYVVLKPRLEKTSEDDYRVVVMVTNEMTGLEQEFNSEYANSFFKEI
jgi:hypothetical protein